MGKIHILLNLSLLVSAGGGEGSPLSRYLRGHNFLTLLSGAGRYIGCDGSQTSQSMNPLLQAIYGVEVETQVEDGRVQDNLNIGHIPLHYIIFISPW